MIAECLIDNVRVLTLHVKRLDAAVATQFDRAILRWLDRRGEPLVLDMSRVDFIDSMGLRSLVALSTAVGELYVTGATRAVMTVFRLTSTKGAFGVFDEIGEAVARVRWKRFERGRPQS